MKLPSPIVRAWIDETKNDPSHCHLEVNTEHVGGETGNWHTPCPRMDKEHYRHTTWIVGFYPHGCGNSEESVPDSEIPEEVLDALHGSPIFPLWLDYWKENLK